MIGSLILLVIISCFHGKYVIWFVYTILQALGIANLAINMVKYKYGELKMKTTIEIPEKLFRQAKSRAALEGLSLREFFLRGLQLALQAQPEATSKRRANFPLVKTQLGAPHLTDEQVAEALNTDEDIL
jgi:hypothetical protein